MTPARSPLRALNALLLSAAAGCGAAASGPPAPWAAFGAPEAVTVRGFGGTTMEPFVSPDGQTLYFNDSNDPANDTDLYTATRVDDLTFDYAGPLTAADSTSLDAVASVDAAGELFFVSTRSYATTRSTVYRIAAAGEAAALVEGIAASAPGRVILDAGVTRDGQALYLAEGDYSSGALTTAELVLARRTAGGFERAADGPALLAAVNPAGGTVYAPAASASGLELFFTRQDGTSASIWMATRASTAEPFGAPHRIEAITGFAEAPALSPDERSLYYHALVGDAFALRRVRRP